MELGRVRVQLLNTAGLPINTAIKNKKQFLEYCCDHINNLKGRPVRVEKLIKMEQQEATFLQTQQEKQQEKKEANLQEQTGNKKKKNRKKK